jgi:hypothetical protein
MKVMNAHSIVEPLQTLMMKHDKRSVAEISMEGWSVATEPDAFLPRADWVNLAL